MNGALLTDKGLILIAYCVSLIFNGVFWGFVLTGAGRRRPAGL